MPESSYAVYSDIPGTAVSITAVPGKPIGGSMISLIIDGIDDALGKIEERRKIFEPFYGIWTDKDAAEFKEATKDFETIDPGDWKPSEFTLI